MFLYLKKAPLLQVHFLGLFSFLFVSLFTLHTPTYRGGREGEGRRESAARKGQPGATLCSQGEGEGKRIRQHICCLLAFFAFCFSVPFACLFFFQRRTATRERQSVRLRTCDETQKKPNRVTTVEENVEHNCKRTDKKRLMTTNTENRIATPPCSAHLHTHTVKWGSLSVCLSLCMCRCSALDQTETTTTEREKKHRKNSQRATTVLCTCALQVVGVSRAFSFVSFCFWMRLLFFFERGEGGARLRAAPKEEKKSEMGIGVPHFLCAFRVSAGTSNREDDQQSGQEQRTSDMVHA